VPQLTHLEIPAAGGLGSTHALSKQLTYLTAISESCKVVEPPLPRLHHAKSTCTDEDARAARPGSPG
jgi:hypothetical protein